MATNRNVNEKRTDYIKWGEYFMATAFLAAKRSKDPVTQVGACIVNEDKRIVGVGYNGMPNGCNDNVLKWDKMKNSLSNKHLYVCHAELNAILNKYAADLKNCTMYVALFPCNECAKLIIQSRIKKVVYMSDKQADKLSTRASKRMLDVAGVKYKQFKPKNNEIVIDFSEINWNAETQLSPTSQNEGEGEEET